MSVDLTCAFIVYLSFGYLIGSITFGVIISRLFGLGNLREIGSGNIGATNVLRTGHKLAAISTLLCDAAKGAAVIMIVKSYSIWDLLIDYQPYIVAFGAVLGHIYPVWLRFKGGKGVATVAGCTLTLNIWVGLSLIIIWLLTFIIKRLSSLSAIAAIVSAPIIALLYRDFYLACWFALISPLVMYTHRDNIKRLIQKKEIGLGHDSIAK